MSTTPTAIERAPVAMKNGLVQLTNIDEAFRFAKAVQISGLAPSSFKSPEAILIATQMGAELGLTPMMSLKTISVVNGRPAIGGKDMPSIVLRSGLLETWNEVFEGAGDDLTAVCRVKRKGIEGERVGRFSVADARRAGLWGTATWAKYPRDMLTYKARARAFQLFADVLAGLPVAEDISDVLTEKTSPAPQERKIDPLLVEVQGAVVEETTETVVPTTTTGTSTTSTTEAHIANEPEPEAEPPAPETLATPDESVKPKDLFAEPQPEIPTNADLLAALNELASNTAGQKTAELRARIEQAWKMLPADKWNDALKRASTTEKGLQKLDPVGLRKLLCSCVDAVKARETKS
jgi:hypothetical protein